MAPSNQPTPAQVATGIVEGMRNDAKLGCVSDFDAELQRRIADVIEGEREMARLVFDFYATPFDAVLPGRSRGRPRGPMNGPFVNLSSLDLQVVADAYKTLGWRWGRRGIPGPTEIRGAIDRLAASTGGSSGGLCVARGRPDRVAFSSRLWVLIAAYSGRALVSPFETTDPPPNENT